MQKARSGFSIIEILVAMSLLAIISTMVFVSLAKTFDLRDSLAKAQGEIHGAQVALEKLAQEVGSAFLSPNKLKDGDRELPPEKQPWFFIGKSDSLTFTAFAHQRLFKNVKESDQTELSYALEDSPKGNGKDLVRKEWKRIYYGEKPSTAQPDSLALIEKVQTVAFRYCNPEKGEWQTEWNSTQTDWLGKLPLAVEITVKINTLNEEERVKEEELTSFKTIAFIQSVSELDQIGQNKVLGCSDEKIL